jgi:hypothetical protein
MDMLRSIAGLIAGVAVSAVAGYQLAYKPWRRQWEAGRDETARTLPGDELIPDADFTQTMAVTIDAPPSAVWPWLLQMGYGRGGWYSYDAIDMRDHSVREILPELQDLAVGRLIPFAPEMSFRVERLDPEHALVLYGDSKLVEQQQHAAEKAGDGERPEEEPPGLKVVGAISQANMSEFKVSWAFVLDPLDGGRTRLLERFHTRSTRGPATAIVGPLVDHGHFLMTRKQMLGIKERAEMTAGSVAAPTLRGAVAAAS